MYEILPQDIKRRGRKELEKIDTSRPRTPYLFITQEYIKNGPFYIEFMAYMGTFRYNLTHQT